MSAFKTYLLAPNPLAHIIPPLETVTTTKLELSNSRSLHSSVRVQSLQSASAEANTKASKDVLTRYAIDNLEAAYLRID
jgi:hypothetical protein